MVMYMDNKEQEFAKDYEDLIEDLIDISFAIGEYTGAWDDETDNKEVIVKFETLMIQKCDEYGIEVKDYEHYHHLYSDNELGDERAFALYEELEKKIKNFILRD